MKTLAFFLLAFYSVPAYAGISVCYDQNGAVSRYQLRGDALQGCDYFDPGSNPDVSQSQYDSIKTLLKTQPPRYVKKLNGFPVLMSPTEQQAVDDALSAELDAALQARKDAEPLLEDLNNQAAAGIAAIDSYLAGADTATAAQVRAEVKAIDQRQKKIIAALNRFIQREFQ